VVPPAAKKKAKVAAAAAAAAAAGGDDSDGGDDGGLADLKMLLQKHNAGKKSEAVKKARQRAREFETKRAKPSVMAVRKWEARTGDAYAALGVAEREAVNAEIHAGLVAA
jgi:hypothetical protein